MPKTLPLLSAIGMSLITLQVSAKADTWYTYGVLDRHGATINYQIDISSITKMNDWFYFKTRFYDSLDKAYTNSVSGSRISCREKVFYIGSMFEDGQPSRIVQGGKYWSSMYDELMRIVCTK